MLTRADILSALALPPHGEGSDNDLNPGWPRPAEESVRPAAVLCGIVSRASGLQVVLTRRTPHLRHHAGQICFPGGKLAPGDASAEAAALREAEEEIGLGHGDAEMLGPLDDYVTVTGFRVTPFVGMVAPGWRPAPDPEEVAEVFEVPLDFLMDPANRVRHSYRRGGVPRHYYAMPWGDRYIWGATAGMLKGLSDRLRRVRAGGGSRCG
jgi:8-oxo-dGTP pyrophosphatase MutT (NUDIX family)